MAGFEADLGENVVVADYELRISLNGDVPHVQEIPVTLYLDTTLTGLHPGQGFHVMVIQPQGSDLESWLAPLILTEELSFPGSGGQKLIVQVPANAFLRDESLTDGRLEAIVILLKTNQSSPAE